MRRFRSEASNVFMFSLERECDCDVQSCKKLLTIPVCYRFPLTSSRTASILRKFILSPSTVFESIGELSASPALRVAGKYYAACVDVSP